MKGLYAWILTKCLDNWKFQIAGRMDWTWQCGYVQYIEDKNLPCAKAKCYEKDLMVVKSNL